MHGRESDPGPENLEALVDAPVDQEATSPYPEAPPEAGSSNETDLTPEEKAARIQDLVTAHFDGETPDALFALAGGIIASPNRANGWRTFGWSHTSEHGIATASRTRVIATAEIAEAVPNMLIVTDSYNRFDPDEPTMASVVKNELIHRGVDEDRVLMEEDSFSTFTELTEMIKMALDKGWTKVLILSNEYHLPRISEMYARLNEIVDDAEFQELLQTFKDGGGKVEFTSAEPVMRVSSPWYDRYLDAAERSPQYVKTLEGEAQGLADLRAGKYRVRLNPEKPRTGAQ